MALSKKQCDLLGGIVAAAAFLLADAVFVARLAGSHNAEQFAGILFLGLSVPVTYLLISAFRGDRPGIYFIWLGLFLLFLVVEAVLDYLLQIPFREVRWQVILYVMLFFGSLGGLIGVAGLAGRGWTVAAILGFLSTASLALAQHLVTGL